MNQLQKDQKEPVCGKLSVKEIKNEKNKYNNNGQWNSKVNIN